MSRAFFCGKIDVWKNFTGNNYRTFSRDVQLKIDENVAEKVIPADDSVRLLDQIVEEMDKTPLNDVLPPPTQRSC